MAPPQQSNLHSEEELDENLLLGVSARPLQLPASHPDPRPLFHPPSSPEVLALQLSTVEVVETRHQAPAPFHLFLDSHETSPVAAARCHSPRPIVASSHLDPVVRNHVVDLKDHVAPFPATSIRSLEHRSRCPLPESRSPSLIRSQLGTLL